MLLQQGPSVAAASDVSSLVKGYNNRLLLLLVLQQRVSTGGGGAAAAEVPCSHFEVKETALVAASMTIKVARVPKEDEFIQIVSFVFMGGTKGTEGHHKLLCVFTERETFPLQVTPDIR